MKNIYIIFILLVKLFECDQGVYSYVDKKTGKTHYVGMTNDFDRRDKEHKSAKHYYASSKYELQKINMPGVSRNKMYEEEKRQIKNKKPVANKYAGGNGPK